jgi:hypothetical protein
MFLKISKVLINSSEMQVSHHAKFLVGFSRFLMSGGIISSNKAF